MELDDIKEKIIAAILEKYGMTVRAFSDSRYPSILGIKGGNTLRCYLQGNSTSLPTLNILCKHFGLGELKRKIEVVRKVTYELTENTAAPVKIPRKVKRS